MSFASWAADHRRSLLLLLALLALGGAAAALRLPVALFPHVDFPRIRVSLDAGDRPADQMAIAVTRPVEVAVRSVPGVRDIRSTTSRGSADLSINFDWGSDMPLALQQVESAINQVLPSLPAGTRFSARRMDPTVFPMAAYSLTSKTIDPVRLRDIAEYQLVPLLSAINGVARVNVIGGAQAEYRVDVDPARLLAYGLTVDDVVKALSAANVLRAVGRLEDHYKLYLMLSDTRFRDLDQIRHTILRSGDNGLVELADVATVSNATVPQWLRVTADGHDAVLLQVYQQPGGNTVQIAVSVKAKLAGLSASLPPGVTIAQLVRPERADHRVGAERARCHPDRRRPGGAGAAGVPAQLQGDARSRSWWCPPCWPTTVLLLYVLNMSFNIMTLGGMAAAVGLIIDDAIVMIEHIMRRLRGGAGSHHDRVMDGGGANSPGRWPARRPRRSSFSCRWLSRAA